MTVIQSKKYVFIYTVGNLSESLSFKFNIPGFWESLEPYNHSFVFTDRTVVQTERMSCVSSTKAVREEGWT